MAYRNGTYIAFHAQGTNVPIDTDMKYFYLMKAWTEKENDDFSFVDSHQKTGAVRDSSLRTTLRNALLERLRNSKNFVLLVGETTRFDNDWVPFEISKAVDAYALPIIAVYPGYGPILEPAAFRPLWPKALADRIDNDTARVIHIPFKKEPLKAAIDSFDHNNQPGWALTYYTREAYVNWGLLAP